MQTQAYIRAYPLHRTSFTAALNPTFGEQYSKLQALVRSKKSDVCNPILSQVEFRSDFRRDAVFPLLRALLQSIANLVAPVDRDSSELLLTGTLTRLYFQEEVRTDQIVL
jgi:hypothetical protein